MFFLPVFNGNGRFPEWMKAGKAWVSTSFDDYALLVVNYRQLWAVFIGVDDGGQGR